MSNLLTTSSTQVRLSVPEASADLSGITFYTVRVEIGRVEWRVRRRYNDFAELHTHLVADHGLAKATLPEKRLIGNRQPAFILKRRRELEEYLQIVLTFLLNDKKDLGEELVHFLELHKYDTHFITRERLKIMKGLGNEDTKDEIEKEEDEKHDLATIWTPLELYSLRESLKSPLPQSGPNEDVLTDLADLACAMSCLEVKGCDEFWGASNIVPNNLAFDLLTFKSLTTLIFADLPLGPQLIRGLGALRGSLKCLKAHRCQLTSAKNALLCDTNTFISGENENVSDEWIWNQLEHLDLRCNSIRSIDAIEKLAPRLQTLLLGKNGLEMVPNVSALSQLIWLDISENRIELRDEQVNLKDCLDQVQKLDLQGNRINDTKAFSELNKLKHLNLSHNRISDVEKTRDLGNLDALEVIELQGNMVCNVVDYRLKVLESFGKRACQIALDNQKPSQAEIDKVAVLMALRVAKECRPPTSLFGNLPSCA